MADKLLTAALAAPVEIPGEHDWSFRADDPVGGFNRYGWGAEDQALFDACWDDGVSALTDGLIEAYSALCPWPMIRLAPAREPSFASRVMDLAERRAIGQRHTYKAVPEMVFELAMLYGSFDRLRAVRTWSAAPELVCPVCGRTFASAILSPWMLRQYGPPRFCNYCSVRARTGQAYGSVEQAIAGLRALAAAIEGIPEQSIHSTIILGGMSDERRDRAIAGLTVSPSPEQAKALLGPKWLAVLHAAGIVGDAWRATPGTACFASDGHRCRSLAKRTVDDFLAARGIAHVPEPAYPGSKRRADWSLPRRHLIEYAGLLSDASYRAKIEQKRQLAASAGVPLIVLVPEDLVDLARAPGCRVKHDVV